MGKVAKRKAAIRASIKADKDEPMPVKKTREEMLRVLCWYSQNKDEKVAAKYLGLKDPNLAKDYCSLAWGLRMKSHGFSFNEKEEATLARMQTELNKALKASQVVVTKAPANVVSIQDRVQAKTDYFIGELEGLIDAHGITGNFNDTNAYKWMVDNEVKAIHATRIAEYFRNNAKEVFEAATGKDEDLVEGYSSYSKKRLANLLKCYAAIIKDAEQIADNQKVARKPRKKKPLSFDKMVSKLTYAVKDDKLKLQSINPVKIIGAQQLWVYNTKTRKLGVYNATDASGLSVKGSTLQGFNESQSICKTLRKPEKVLTSVTEGGKVVLRKLLEGIKGKPTQLNGRINKDTLLLRMV